MKDEITKLIENAIRDHMPSAAVASGWMSEVDCAPWVKAMCERFPYGERPENLGLTPLRGWLKERGVEAGEKWVRKLREVWIKDVMRVECGGVPRGD